MTENFLDHYFLSIYNKLEADALLFNRRIPHSGLAGSENESAVADVIRTFLPEKYGIEVGGILIDRHGNVSKQCDIIIYDAFHQPSYFRKVFPIERVYGVIEVKTSLSSDSAKIAQENLESICHLDFRPSLANYWATRTEKENIQHDPPFLCVFSYRSSVKAWEAFGSWFSWDLLHKGPHLKMAAPKHPEIRTFTVCALDKGLIKMESTNGHIARYAAISDREESARSFTASIAGGDIKIDPAKSLFLFLNTLWCRIEQHNMHPGFDIRSYMSPVMDSIIEV
tara:strand:+ start:1639 stop:2484 length:846 start_codon:yes stop_codon:yes gene_type:complete